MNHARSTRTRLTVIPTRTAALNERRSLATTSAYRFATPYRFVGLSTRTVSSRPGWSPVDPTSVDPTRMRAPRIRLLGSGFGETIDRRGMTPASEIIARDRQRPPAEHIDRGVCSIPKVENADLQDFKPTAELVVWNPSRQGSVWPSSTAHA